MPAQHIKLGTDALILQPICLVYQLPIRRSAYLIAWTSYLHIFFIVGYG